MTHRETETLDASLGEARSAPGEARSALVLAYAERGVRAPEQRQLPPEGLVLGRGAFVFGGGPLEDPRISRRHARLRRRGAGWVICDLESRNGVWIDGARIEGEAALAPGAVIRVGDTLLLYGLVAARFRGYVGLVGVGAPAARLRQSLRAAAPHPVSVLLTGETGTGKEVAARALHALSARGGAFVPVNCAAFTEGVLESELFGHVRGAFTGADRARDGLFQAADGGTLFLDEVGEISPALQGRLLRALETGRIRPVGASRERAVDARVVAATNRDLVEMVRDERFRADLYARLAQWTVELPPLRDRPEDLPALIHHLLVRLGVWGRGLDIDLASALLRHPWSLNVRGLLNVLTAAMVARPRGPLGVEPAVEVALRSYRARAARPGGGATPRAQAPDEAALRAALVEARGSVAGAARALGTSRQQIYRWLKQHGLALDDFRS